MEYHFGDKVLYCSPIKDDLKTECIFIRDDNGKAVVMFRHAEWAARVNYSRLISCDEESTSDIYYEHPIYGRLEL